jgi:hypothetical protein
MNTTAKERLEQLENQKKFIQEQIDGLKDSHRSDYVQLEDYLPQERINKFDQIYKVCDDYIQEIIQEGGIDDDAEHYLYEAVMELTLGKNIFKLLNKLSD